MTRTITYSLRLGGRNSDEYYRTIAAFTDKWLAETLPHVRDILAGFRSFREANGQSVRSEAELAFELLVLGVLLRERGAEAAGSPAWLQKMLVALVRAQDRWPRLEGAVKAGRGLLHWMGGRQNARRSEGRDIPCLLAWLRAQGEAGRAARLEQWSGYLAGLGSGPGQAITLRCLALADDFAEQSRSDLGKYTAGVDKFLSSEAPKFRRRYDSTLVSSSQLEYHLGMLGTELLNRAYRARFLASRRRIVIAPPCMRARPEEECQAAETPLGARCQACTPNCRVHQLTRLGEKHGFEVYIIPDELHVFGSGTGQAGLGLLGISCVLTNWNGGWEADAMGVPAQGLLLDYVGCRYHWDKQGIPTDTNLNKLKEALGIPERLGRNRT